MAKEPKHEKPCSLCGGSGMRTEQIMDRATGRPKDHRVTCVGCQGTGKA